jgi:glucokinase
MSERAQPGAAGASAGAASAAPVGASASIASAAPAGASTVGIDLGGTKVAAALLRGGELGEVQRQPTCLSDSDQLLAQLVAITQACGDGFEAVGIGVPSVVEFATGRVVTSVNIPLADVPLRDVLGERLGVPVFVDNDATVAALAEAHDERLRLSAQNLVMITIGTGVGGGIVIGGRIYRGASGGAGELGHTLVALALTDEQEVPAPAPSFPQPASLECAAAGHALDRLARAAAARAPDSALGRRAATGAEVLGADAVAAALGGDGEAERAVRMWAQRVGVGIANVINTFEPDEVVLGGGAAHAGELLLETAERVARGYVVSGLGAHTRVRLARHAEAGVLGAALLARQELSDAPTRERSPLAPGTSQDLNAVSEQEG